MRNWLIIFLLLVSTASAQLATNTIRKPIYTDSNGTVISTPLNFTNQVFMSVPATVASNLVRFAEFTNANNSVTNRVQNLEGRTNQWNLSITNVFSTGLGTGLVRSVSGNIANLKTLLPGTSVTFGDDGTNVTINSSGGSSAAALTNQANTFLAPFSQTINGSLTVSGVTFRTQFDAALATNLNALELRSGTIPTARYGAEVVQTSVTLSVTAPITGGGDLSANRTFGFDGSQTFNASGATNIDASKLFGVVPIANGGTGTNTTLLAGSWTNSGGIFAVTNTGSVVEIDSFKANSLKIGIKNTQTGSNSVNIGLLNSTQTNNSLAIGVSNKVFGSTSQFSYSLGVGFLNQVTNNSSMAFGISCAALSGGIAIGNGAFSSNGFAVAIGSSPQAYGASSTAIGPSAFAWGNKSIALGSSAFATNNNSIAISSGPTSGAFTTNSGEFVVGAVGGGRFEFGSSGLLINSNLTITGTFSAPNSTVATNIVGDVIFPINRSGNTYTLAPNYSINVTNNYNNVLTLNKALVTSTLVVTNPPTGSFTNDWSLASEYQIFLTNNCIPVPINYTNGQQMRYVFVQDPTGSRTVTLNFPHNFGSDITGFTATTTANKRDRVGLLGYVTSTTNVADVVAVTKGF